MLNFEYLLKYHLQSKTLKLISVKKLPQIEAFKFKNENLKHCFFDQKEKNTKVPLFNLNIDFTEKKHKLTYGLVFTGKSVFVEKEYGMEFKPVDADNFICFDEDLKCISDFENEEDEKENFSVEQKNSKQNQSNDFDQVSFQDLHKNFEEEYEAKNIRKYESNRIHSKPNENMQKMNIKKNFEKILSECPNIKNQTYPDPHTLTDTNPDIRKFTYIIKDNSFILPLYELEFSFDINLELRTKNSNLCEKCEKNEANMFCVAEQASFCQECDQKLHYDTFTRRHIRHYFKIIGSKQKFFNCESHPDTVVDYFCVDCKQPTCTQCRIKNIHSNNHNLITYFEANELADELKKKEFDYEQKRIEKSILFLKERIFKFRSNINEVKDHLEKQYRNIKSELEMFINQKYQIFNPLFLEYKTNHELFSYKKKFIHSIDNSEIIRNFNTIEEQLKVDLKEEFKLKYKSIFLMGHLYLEKDEGIKRNYQGEHRKY